MTATTTRAVSRRRVPSPWLGVKVGGSLACLVPLACAIAQILGGAA